MSVVVYVSGPISQGNWLINIRLAVQSGERLRRAGFVPLVPHLIALAELCGSDATYEDWLALDLALLERCDALLRLPGPSVGADREVEHARALGLPVFFNELDIPRPRS